MMIDRRVWRGLGAAAVVVGVVGLANAAGAVSTGGYDPARQDCSPTADANTTKAAQPGCHNTKLSVSDGSGHRYAQAGTDQEAQRDNLHGAGVSVTPNGSGAKGQPALGAHVDTNWQPLPANQCALFDVIFFPIDTVTSIAGQGGKPCTLDPTKWQAPGKPPTLTPTVRAGSPDGSVSGLVSNADLYFGADDNVDTGEHDGVNGKNNTGHSANGPSDGGSLEVRWHPTAAAGWPGVISAALAGKPAALASDPMRVADLGAGGCADGMCVGAYTAKRSIYQGGGGSGQNRDAYNYQGKTFGPSNCSSGDSSSEQACSDPKQGGHSGGMDYYRQQEAKNVNVEPGVVVYEDPDPQGSPVLPTYPIPAAYVGTCGVVAGGGVVPLPASPVTNKAGQVVVNPTGC